MKVVKLSVFFKLLAVYIVLSQIGMLYSQTGKVVFDGVHFPAPAGMKHVASPTPEFIAEWGLAIDSNHKLVAVFVTEWDSGALYLKIPPKKERVCDLHVQANYLDKRMTLGEFTWLVSSLRDRIANGEFEQQLNRQTEAGGNAKISPNRSTAAAVQGRLRPISDYQGHNFFIFTGIPVKYADRTGVDRGNMRVVTTGLLLLNGRFFELRAISQSRTDADTNWTRTTMKSWIDSINAGNQSVPVAPMDLSRVLSAAGGVVLFVLILIFIFRFMRKTRNKSRIGTQ